VALSLGACAAEDERLDLPTSNEPMGTGMAANLVATLEGDADEGCVWLLPTTEVDGVDDEGRLAAVWPAGFKAWTDPIRVFDDTDVLVGEQGDTLDLSGGAVPFEAALADKSSPAHEIPARCRTSEIFWAVSDYAIRAD
jgi:hypothetical protein